MATYVLLIGVTVMIAGITGYVAMVPALVVACACMGLPAALLTSSRPQKELPPVADDPKTPEREDVLDRAKREYVEAPQDTLIGERIDVLEKAVVEALEGRDPFPPKETAEEKLAELERQQAESADRLLGTIDDARRVLNRREKRELARAPYDKTNTKHVVSTYQHAGESHPIPTAMSGPLASRPAASSVADGSVWYAEDLDNQAWVARGGAWVAAQKAATFGEFVYGDVLPAVQANYPTNDLAPVWLANGPLQGKVVTKGRFRDGIYRESLSAEDDVAFVGGSGDFPVMMKAGKVVEYRLEKTTDPAYAGWMGLEVGT